MNLNSYFWTILGRGEKSLYLHVIDQFLMLEQGTHSKTLVTPFTSSLYSSYKFVELVTDVSIIRMRYITIIGR
jgi:hypothetical protein